MMPNSHSFAIKKDFRRAFHLAALLLSPALGAGCASAPLPRPSDPLVAGEPTWPEDVEKRAEHADRVCGTREAQLEFDYQAGKEEQNKFKTILGSITGAVGTAGGVAGGIGAFVIKDPDTVKTMTGVTGFVSGGLGAIGSLVTALVSPGAAKMKSSAQSLTTIEASKAKARAALQKDPAAWSDADREAFTKATTELESACK
jgi:hypothetical protein